MTMIASAQIFRDSQFAIAYHRSDKSAGATMTIPDKMRAVVLTGHGGLDKLEYHEDWPTPVPDAGTPRITNVP